jgi:hypothetical protein
MRRIYLAFTVVITGAGLLFTPPMNVALAHGPGRVTHQDFPPRPGATPIVIGLPNLNPPTATTVPSGSHPQNSPKSRAPQDAVRVALTNTYVKALLKGRAYRIQKVAPWRSSTGKLVVVAFYAATTVSGTWMAVGKSPYRATYHSVTGLQVYVMPARKLVVGIVPHTQSR